MDKNKRTQLNRAKVSELIFKVLTSQICVKQALDSFPKDSKDKSLECTWHALIHFEADEDIKDHNADFAKEQEDYLEMIAFILKEGKELPDNIIASYNKYYKGTVLPQKANIITTLKTLFRFTT